MAAGLKRRGNFQTFPFVSGRGKMQAATSLILVMGCLITFSNAQTGRFSCTDEQGRAQRCMPSFENAAFGLAVEATNTCGISKVTEYCFQTGVTGATKTCQYCDARVQGLAHPPEHMTDFNTHLNSSWWQSETMLEDVQYPNTVNLTLHLKKAYDITYVRIRFQSSRPESFVIFKKTREESDWEPFQFYSASCESTFNMERDEVILRGNEARAVCTDDYSDISPLTGGTVAFSTLVGRPSAYNFDNSPELQEWVTASKIMIVLNRLNTFGDEVFEDPQVLKSYFYAISDIAVGARCKCNGHASQCISQTGQGLEETLVCQCEHSTMGPNCEQCLPFFNDRPWRAATTTDAFECQPCNCNNLATECYFDAELYRRTGHGGHCKDCRDNTAGANCELCKRNYFRRPADNRCADCQCDEIGSESLQCDGLGRCRCKPGVTGDKCDRCETNFYSFGPQGCRACACVQAGSLDNNPRCSPDTGDCSCKVNVEGQDCDRCKPGFFGLSLDNPFGCEACFCYSHSSNCNSAAGYYARDIETTFDTGKARWKGTDRQLSDVSTQYSIIQELGISSDGQEATYFRAPARYLGDQRFSYNQFLRFTFRIGEEEGARASILDVVLEGNGQTLSIPIFGQGNALPKVTKQDYEFRLHEHTNFQWTPRLKAQDFVAILSNLTELKIRGTYTPGGVGFIDNIRLETARRGFNGGEEATWVEQCSCPDGYVGQFCESCAPGFRREPSNGGPFANCVPCNCHGHSAVCEVNTGRCICEHNTVGDNCERCAPGYYGNALLGSADDCTRCPCPGGGPCVQLANGEVVCTECREGYMGNRCDYCADGYFGDPSGRYGAPRQCERCSCNDNIDPNAVGNCNRTTGECLKCIYNTAGFYCERCLSSSFGDALALPKGQCQPCRCNPRGTIGGDRGDVLSCDPLSGQCPCLPNVRGKYCDQCEDSYWNLQAGKGCEPCFCDRAGALNATCGTRSGQCICKNGVTGRKCDHCQSYFWGLNRDGCRECNCDPEGSYDLQCDEYGNCPCRPSVEGRQCDRCSENKYNITAGCVNCAPCYNLVQERVNIHRQHLRKLNDTINMIGSDPKEFNNTAFVKLLQVVNSSVITLLNDAQVATGRDGGGGGGGIGRELEELRRSIREVLAQCGRISIMVRDAASSSQRSIRDIYAAEEAIGRAEKVLLNAERYLLDEGSEALKRAKDAVKLFGDQSLEMSSIANRARTEADRQMMESIRIDVVANEALNTSREALDLARNAINMPGTIQFEIQKLRQQYGDAERLYEQTRIFAETARQLAQRAYQEALDLYSDANSLQIPGADVTVITVDSERIKIEAAEIKRRAEQLMDDNRDLMEDVRQQKLQAEQLFLSGVRQQQRADELLAEADAARAKAREAVALGENTLLEANRTLNILLKFDFEIEESKTEAVDALTKVAEIERLILEAESKSTEARNALSGAESDANMAFDLAKRAKELAFNASDEASRILDDSRDTQNRATGLKDHADDIFNNVKIANESIVQFEVQSNDDEKQAQEALQKANQAKVTAQDASGKVQGALQTVIDILKILGEQEDVDINKLEELERDLNAVEQQLADSGLDQQYDELKLANQQQSILVNGLMVDLEQLRKDVNNIEEIKNKLPDGCFKREQLEPELIGR